MNRRNSNQFGFTLLELLVTISIACILLTVGIPTFRTVVLNNRMTASTNNLVSAFHLARSEAVKRRVPVTICRSDDPAAAIPVCAAGPGADGLIVFTDDGGAGPGAPIAGALGILDGGDTVLQVNEPSDGDVTLRAEAGVGNFVSIASSGFTTSNGNLLMCDNRGNEALTDGASTARAILVSASGRVQARREHAYIVGLTVACP